MIYLIREEQIVVSRHSAGNGYLCTDPTCPCWRDEEEDYEPYYSRAEEEADIATAAYYDELAHVHRARYVENP